MAVAAINAVMLVLGLGELDSINALHSALTGYFAFWQSSREKAQAQPQLRGRVAIFVLPIHVVCLVTHYTVGVGG